MKKSAVTILLTAGLLSAMLSGCQTSGETGAGTLEHVSEPVISTEGEINKEEDSTRLKGTETEVPKVEQETESEEEEQISALPYQFASKYGIIKSIYPIYELDTVIESELPQKEKTIYVTSAIYQEKELLVSMVMLDYSEAKENPADSEPYSQRYQNELWKSGEGLFLTGPGIPEDGLKPQESVYMSDPAYFEEYGHMRYIIEAMFALPSAPDPEDQISGYALRLLDFEEPQEFDLKRVPEYGTLEELAAAEHGSIDTHDGISIISMGEKVKDGILVTWYLYREAGERTPLIAYKPPYQEVDLPTISSQEKQYLIRQVAANPYWDNLGHYRLSDIKRYGRRTRCLYDVPQNEQNASFQMNIPGITFLNYEESTPVTLPVPQDYEELNVDIPWKDGSVRILGITKMKEPQTVEIEDVQGKVKTIERPAVYIDVMAVHEDKDLVLRGLICKRKLRYTGWENERYDFDDKGNLSGFRIFYEEGDTEVTLKFNGAAFYWNQPYVMQLPLPD